MTLFSLATYSLQVAGVVRQVVTCGIGTQPPPLAGAT